MSLQAADELWCNPGSLVFANLLKSRIIVARMSLLNETRRARAARSLASRRRRSLGEARATVPAQGFDEGVAVSPLLWRRRPSIAFFLPFFCSTAEAGDVPVGS
jgi:hypothetical protein